MSDKERLETISRIEIALDRLRIAHATKSPDAVSARISQSYDELIIARGLLKDHPDKSAQARITELEAFLKSLLSPEEFGWTVRKEVRDGARELLGMKRVETGTEEPQS